MQCQGSIVVVRIPRSLERISAHQRNAAAAERSRRSRPKTTRRRREEGREMRREEENTTSMSVAVCTFHRRRPSFTPQPRTSFLSHCPWALCCVVKFDGSVFFWVVFFFLFFFSTHFASQPTYYFFCSYFSAAIFRRCFFGECNNPTRSSRTSRFV